MEVIQNTDDTKDSLQKWRKENVSLTHSRNMMSKHLTAKQV